MISTGCLKWIAALAALFGGTFTMSAPTLPADGYIGDTARQNGQQEVALEAVRGCVHKAISGDGKESATIATGSITPTKGIVLVRTESAAATDDLTNIVGTNYNDGDIIMITVASGSEKVTVKNMAGGSGQVQNLNNADLDLETSGVAWLEYFAASSPPHWFLFSLAPLPLSSDQIGQWRGIMGVQAAQAHQFFNTAGAHTFTVPAGVTQIEATLASGGGGGGGGSDISTGGTSGVDGGDTNIKRSGTTLAVAEGASTAGGGATTAAGGVGGQGGALTPVVVIGGCYPGGSGSGVGGRRAASQLGPRGGSGGGGLFGGGGGGVGFAQGWITVTPGETLDVNIGALGTGGAGGGTGTSGQNAIAGAVLIRW